MSVARVAPLGARQCVHRPATIKGRRVRAFAPHTGCCWAIVLRLQQPAELRDSSATFAVTIMTTRGEDHVVLVLDSMDHGRERQHRPSCCWSVALQTSAGMCCLVVATHLDGCGQLDAADVAAIDRGIPSLAHASHRRSLAGQQREAHDSLRQSMLCECQWPSRGAPPGVPQQPCPVAGPKAFPHSASLAVRRPSQSAI